MSMNGQSYTVEDNRRGLLTDIICVSVRTVVIAIADGAGCVAGGVD